MYSGVSLAHIFLFLSSVRFPTVSSLFLSHFSFCARWVPSQQRQKILEVATLTVGEYFGELAVLDSTPRAVSIVSNTPVRLYCLNRVDFYNCCKDSVIEDFRRSHSLVALLPPHSFFTRNLRGCGLMCKHANSRTFCYKTVSLAILCLLPAPFFCTRYAATYPSMEQVANSFLQMQRWNRQKVCLSIGLCLTPPDRCVLSPCDAGVQDTDLRGLFLRAVSATSRLGGTGSQQTLLLTHHVTSRLLKLLCKGANTMYTHPDEKPNKHTLSPHNLEETHPAGATSM